jgi:putative addiction module component (TIGR02574 family)
MDISELRSLPIDQKIEIIGKLWDDVIDSDSPIVLPPTVIAEIDRRRAAIDADPSIAIDRDELWRRVNESRLDDG